MNKFLVYLFILFSTSLFSQNIGVGLPFQGLALLNKNTPIGVLYSDNFSPQKSYVAVGSADLTNGILSGGNATLFNYVYYNYVYNLEQFELKRKYIITDFDASTYGTVTGIDAGGEDFQIGMFTFDDPTYNGKIYIWQNNVAKQFVASTFTVTAGDTVSCDITYSFGNLMGKFSSRTGTNTITANVPFTYPHDATRLWTPTDGHFALYTIGGSQKQLSFEISSKATLNATNIVGHSIVSGYYCDSVINRYYTKFFNNNSKFNILAGAGEYLQSTPGLMPLLILLKTSILIIDKFTNNIINNDTPATVQAYLDAIIGPAETAGMTVVLIRPLPCNGHNSFRIDSLIQTYPQKKINLFNPFLIAGDSINPIYSPDGVHLNKKGDSLATTIFQNTY